jgi:hypothetical protein
MKEASGGTLRVSTEERARGAVFVLHAGLDLSRKRLLARLACKTNRIDARVLAVLSHPDVVLLRSTMRYDVPSGSPRSRCSSPSPWAPRSRACSACWRHPDRGIYPGRPAPSSSSGALRNLGWPRVQPDGPARPRWRRRGVVSWRQPTKGGAMLLIIGIICWLSPSPAVPSSIPSCSRSRSSLWSCSS